MCKFGISIKRQAVNCNHDLIRLALSRLQRPVDQIAGCCLSAPLAHAISELPLLQASVHLRTAHWEAFRPAWRRREWAGRARKRMDSLPSIPGRHLEVSLIDRAVETVKFIACRMALFVRLSP
jgi:hypothetical protein